jgi:S-adenosylmethionine/arginine decarboxylase-like enzyme
MAGGQHAPFLVFTSACGYPAHYHHRSSDIPSRGRVEPHVSLTFSHLSVDFIGAMPSQLSDTALISGLLIAGAGAAGFTAVGAPVVRQLPGDAVSVVLLLADCHMSAHAFPSEQLMLLDILTQSARDAQKALDVFTRRLTAREVRCEKRARG